METHLVCSYKGPVCLWPSVPLMTWQHSHRHAWGIYMTRPWEIEAQAFVIGSQVLHRQSSMASPNLPCWMSVWMELTARSRFWCCDVTEWPQELDLRAQRNSQGMTMGKTNLSFTMTQEERAHREVTAELESQQMRVEDEGFQSFPQMTRKLELESWRRKRKAQSKPREHTVGEEPVRTPEVKDLWLYILNLLFYGDGCFVCMVSVYCVFLAPMGARRQHQIPWNSSFRWLSAVICCWEINPVSCKSSRCC